MDLNQLLNSISTPVEVRIILKRHLSLKEIYAYDHYYKVLYATAAMPAIGRDTLNLPVTPLRPEDYGSVTIPDLWM